MPVNLGLLAELPGTWRGSGFNIAASPDFRNRSDVVLNLNLTADELAYDVVPATIHNRGFSQPDIELFGMTYLQHSTDATTGAPIHAEPGFWINQPPTTEPPAEPPPGGQLVARMWSIPHGASMVAQGFALPFCGPPTLSPGTDPTAGSDPAFSVFPSFNSTPSLPAYPDPAASISVAGSSEAQSRFARYDVGTHEALPAEITQQLVNDPIILLQQKVEQQVAEGYQFEGVALNISTGSPVRFRAQPTAVSDPDVLDMPQFGGGIANLGFLRGVSDQKPNLSTALVYATFWLEKLTHPDGRPPLLQLQYAQAALVNFPARNIVGQPNMSWPHVSVSTLHRATV
ncbi:MAG TPA: heme-binding protein [Mycobacterium sp.]|nr:heme-binding protein [Mycobacterium sp.]